MINASLSTSTGRNPNFALNLTAWTHVSASTANAIVSKFILTFVILEGFQYSLNTELTAPSSSPYIIIGLIPRST
ncbi:hypothetical protein V6Z11_D10G156400 [Gossypium hirsutum]